MDGYWNYDKSEFDSPAPLLDDDDALEAIWKREYSLTEFTAPSSFKSYEELEKRLNMVLRVSQPKRSFDEETYNEDNDRGDFNAPDITMKEASVVESRDEDEDDALSYFQKLAEA